MRLNGKVAIVTGSASGIGKEIAQTFVREGACVVIADLNQKAANATATDLGGAGRCSASPWMSPTRSRSTPASRARCSSSGRSTCW